LKTRPTGSQESRPSEAVERSRACGIRRAFRFRRSRRPRGARPSAHQEVAARPSRPHLTPPRPPWDHDNVIPASSMRSHSSLAPLHRGRVSARRVPVSACARSQASTPDSAPMPSAAPSCWGSAVAEGFPPTAALHEPHPAADSARPSAPATTEPQSSDASLVSDRLLDSGAIALPSVPRGHPLRRTAMRATRKPHNTPRAAAFRSKPLPSSNLRAMRRRVLHGPRARERGYPET